MYYRSGPITMVPHQMPYKPAGFSNYRGMLQDAAKVSRREYSIAHNEIQRVWYIFVADFISLFSPDKINKKITSSVQSEGRDSES